MAKRRVADFPEEFITAWSLAAGGELKLEFANRGKAMNYRQQLHAFRKAFVEENGQASCAGWFKYDLGINPAETKDGTRWYITCTVSPVKQQIRDLAAASGIPMPVLPAPKIEAPTSLIPPGLDFATGTPDEAADAVTRGLEKLGFTSK